MWSLSTKAEADDDDDDDDNDDVCVYLCVRGVVGHIIGLLVVVVRHPRDWLHLTLARVQTPHRHRPRTRR